MNLKKLFFIGLFLTTQIIFAQFGAKESLVKIKTLSNQDKIHPGTLLKVAIKTNIKETWHINSNKPNEDFLIASQILSKNEKFPIAVIKYPEAENLELGFSEQPVSVFQGNIVIALMINIDKQLPLGEYQLPLQLKYQACNDQTCMPPTSVTDTLTISVVDSTQAIHVINQDIFNGIDLSRTTTIQNKDDNSIAATFESSGLFLSLLIIFLGGLALNLTPCVYPLIPITIGYFGGQSEGSTSRLFLLGVLYVLGMALTYSVIGVVTSLSGAVFGTLLQNSFVIIGIALLFVLLSLSQFGVYEFKLPDTLVAKAGGAKGGSFGAFFMGLTMGIVAAPCIGPFVLGLVTYVAAKADPFFGFLMFFVLAVGLGFPYLLLALFSGKIKRLPRAGDWMEGVKHIFGFLLLAMAFYFVEPILPKSIHGYILPLFGIITASILLLVDKTANNIKGFRIFKTVFSFIVLAVSIYSLIPAKEISPDWKIFNEAKYAKSLNNNEAMVIDFYADWCIPCKELDALTFSDTRVVEESKKFTLYKVDMTQTLSEENEKLRNKFNIVGMPTVLLIDSKGNEIERLTGFVNADDFLKMMKDVR
ncbi:MAG: protein-disulfide reductase DsbD [Ignavibacteriales bacterium]|nr:protein-disulfide reductase DsbD [Ignavibacteriales bacterium]